MHPQLQPFLLTVLVAVADGAAFCSDVPTTADGEPLAPYLGCYQDLEQGQRVLSDDSINIGYHNPGIFRMC